MNRLKLLTRWYFTLPMALVVTGALWFYASWAFDYIRYTSDSLETDFYLKGGFYLLLLLSSFSLALLYDSTLGHGRWVRNTFGIDADDVPDYLGARALLQSGKAQFYLAWLVAAVALWWAVDAANDGFFSYYSRYGRYVTMLRSGSKAYRAEALARLVGVKKEWIMRMVLDSIEKGPTDEALYTAWAAAEKEVDDPRILEAIRERSKKERGRARVHLLLDLARLGDKTVYLYDQATALVRIALAHDTPPDPLAVMTLAFIGSPRSLDLLREVVRRYPESDAAQVALFALAKLKGISPSERERIRALLSWVFDKGPYRLRCVGVVAAAVVGLDDSLQRRLMWEFESKEAGKVRCSPETFSLHPSGKGHTINITNLHIGGFSYLASAPERYRERILRTLALYKGDDVQKWLEKMSQSPYLDGYMKELVRQAARRKVQKMVPARW